MVRVMWATLRRNTFRYCAPAMAIMLSTLLMAVILVGQDTLLAGIRHDVARGASDYDVVISAHRTNSDQLAAQLPAFQRTPGVDRVTANYLAHTRMGSKNRIAVLVNKPQDATLAEGVWPTASTDIAVSQAMADAHNVSLGGTLQPAAEPGEVPSLTLTVTGIVRDFGATRIPGVDLAVATAETIDTVRGTSSLAQVLVAGSATGVHDVRTLAGTISGAKVQTVDEFVADQVGGMRTALTILTAALLGFVAAALISGGLVIHNTFSVVLARRRQSVALLRLLGATRRQTTLAVVGEAGVVGCVGSLLGATAGVGVAAGVLPLVSDALPFPLSPLTIQPLSMVMPVLAGTVVTVVAAGASALRAGATSPVESGQVPPVQAVARWRVASGAVAIVGAAATLLVMLRGSSASAMSALALTVVAALFLLLGVLAFLPQIVRHGATSIARCCPPGCVPVRVAAMLVSRSPGRSAAVTATLLVAAGLVVTLDTGATHMRASINQQVAAKLPVDAHITNHSTHGLSAGQVAEFAHTVGVVTSAPVISGVVHSPAITVPRGHQGIQLWGITHDAQKVTRSPTQLTVPAPGTVFVAEELGKSWGLSEGQRLTLTPHTLPNVEPTHHTKPETPVTPRSADASATTHDAVTDTGTPRAMTVTVVFRPTYLTGLVANAADAQQITSTRTSAVLLRFADDANAADAAHALTTRAATLPGTSVNTVVAQQQELSAMISGISKFALVMTLAAMLVAMLGVGNTVALSTVDNRRRIALTRALGFTARQARLGVVVEAVIVAVVGVTLGVLLGVLLGWAGATAMLGNYASAVPHVNIVGIAGVIGALIVASAGAAAFPAWQAGRLPPTAAMAR